jgi:ATP-dependent Clp protease ATP-binding subunit ClpA
MSRFDKMTMKAQEAVEAAVAAARGSHNQEVGVEHLILALVSIDGSVAV